MNNSYPRVIILSTLFIALQVWVFNPVSLFRVATPLVYPLILSFFPMDKKPGELMIFGFVIGMIIDYLAFTPGLNTSAFTLTAFIRPYLVKTIANAQDKIEQVPLPSVIEGGAFALLLEVFCVHHLLMYLLSFTITVSIIDTLIHFGAGLTLSFLIAAIMLYTLNIRIYPNKHG